MVTPTVGEVVLVPFPFSDLSKSKKRPAVCLAIEDAARGDWILAQVTSKSYGDPLAVQLNFSDFVNGNLKLISYARPGKLFTANETLLVASIGQLKDESFDKVLEAVVNLLRPDTSGKDGK